MQNIQDIMENFGQDLALDCVGIVDSESTTSEIVVNLTGRQLQENTEVIIEIEFPNGTIEKGICKIAGFRSVNTLPNPQMESESIHQNSLGIKLGSLGDREALQALAEVNCVIKKDVFSEVIEVSGAFSTVPLKNSEVKLFDGADLDVEEKSPFDIGIYGQKLVGDIPNKNYKKSHASRGESRNSAFIGPMGSGKTIGMGQAVVQNQDGEATFVFLDNKGSYFNDTVYGLNLRKEAKENNREFISINVENIVLDPETETIKAVCESFGLYKPTNYLISMESKRVAKFTDALLNDLEDIGFFEDEELNSEQELEKAVRKYTEDENLFINSMYEGDGGVPKKTKLIECLDSNEVVFKAYFDRFEKVRNCFFMSEGKIRTKDLVQEFVNKKKATYVIHNISNYGWGNEGQLLRIFGEILKRTYHLVNRREIPTDLIFVVDESQEIFPKSTKGDFNQEFVELKLAIRKYAIKIMSKLREKGVAFWAAFPSTTQIDSEVLKLVTSHERYLFAGLDVRSEREYFRNCSNEVIKQYENLAFPKKYSNGQLESVSVLLIGQHTPYEPKGKGHFARLTFPYQETGGSSEK